MKFSFFFTPEKSLYIVWASIFNVLKCILFQERLQFDEHGRTCNVGDAEGFLLFLGIFISRSLITTVCIEYFACHQNNS